MSTDRETRIVRSWLKTDEHESAERLLGAVLDRLDATPQRRPLWRAWRTRFMSGTLKFAAAGVVALVVAAGGLALYFSRPTQPPAASPTARPSLQISAPPTDSSVIPPAESPSVPPTADATAAVSDAPFVVFLLDVPGTSPPDDLYAMRADGTGAQKLIEGFGVPSVAWSHDGNRLLAVTEDVNGASHVLMAEVSDVIGPFVDTGFGTGAETACLERSGEPFPCQSAAFSMSPDGNRVVFVQRCTHELPGCMFLTILDLRTGVRTELTETLQEARYPLALPSWSPDGSTIAFTRETDQRVGGSGDIPTSNLWLIDADGTNLREVDVGGLSVSAPQWSPNGTTIAFSANDWTSGSDLETDVYRVTVESGAVIRMTRDGQSSWPEWTADDQIRYRKGDSRLTQPISFWLMTSHGGDATEYVDLSALTAAIDPPREAVKNITVPGDPGKTFFWQPAD